MDRSRGKWHRGPVFQPQIVARDNNVSEKEFGKLDKVIRMGYVIVGEVKILTH